MQFRRSPMFTLTAVLRAAAIDPMSALRME
jgi:hypothetical protein